MQNKFNIEWVTFKHVEFTGNLLSVLLKKNYLSKQLIEITEPKLLHDVVRLYDFAGLLKIHFQSDSAMFDCGRLIKQYLAKAMELLEETHENSQQKKLYNLTGMFKAIFHLMLLS